MRTDCRVLRKMDVRCSLFKLLLFQMLVAWCAAKHVTIDLTRDAGDADERDVQDSIRNLLHTGESDLTYIFVLGNSFSFLFRNEACQLLQC